MKRLPGDVLTRRGVLQGLIAARRAGCHGPTRARRSSHDRRSNAVQSQRCFHRASVLVSSMTSTGSGCTSSKQASRRRAAPPCSSSTAFPELAYSWRKVMQPIAAAGFHVFAPDVRGYGRTSGADVRVHRRPQAVWQRQQDPRHARVGVRAGLSLGRRRHRARSGLAPCRLVRARTPTSSTRLAARRLVRARTHLTLPLGGHDERPVRRPACAAVQYRELTSSGGTQCERRRDLRRTAALTPPRKHYQRYYTTSEANDNMWRPPQGIHAFLRALLPHEKRRLETEPAVSPCGENRGRMGEAAALLRHGPEQGDGGNRCRRKMPSAAEIAACRWLPDAELRVYSDRYGRTGFQGGLNGYRGSPGNADLQLFSGRTIDVPSLFIGGKSDWGVVSEPGCASSACRRR